MDNYEKWLHSDYKPALQGKSFDSSSELQIPNRWLCESQSPEAETLLERKGNDSSIAPPEGQPASNWKRK